MSDWQNYLDLRAPHRFMPEMIDLEEKPILTVNGDGGFLYQGVERFIVSDERCAREFLRILPEGGICLSRQQRVVKILLDLHSSIHTRHSRLAHLGAELKSCMQALDQRAETIFDDEGSEIHFDREAAEESYDLGGDHGAIRYSLAVARRAAHCAFIREFCRRYGSSDSTNGLLGEWHFEISEPQDSAYAQTYAGHFGMNAEATVEKSPSKEIWTARFLHFPPWLNWHDLEGAAYRAAAPVLAQGLQAEVKAVGRLSD